MSEGQPEPPVSPPTPQRSAAAAWAWPTAFAVVVLGMLGAGLWIFESVKRIPAETIEGGRAVVRDLLSVAEAFAEDGVEDRFASYAARTTGTTYLQFATLEQMEIFHRRDTSSLLWGRLALPDIIVEATTPVTYTYYVDLAEDWRFDLADGRLVVHAPEIRYNEPAIDPSGIRLEPHTTSLLRDEEAALEELRDGLSELVDMRARAHIRRVRETGRERIRDFVETWLVTGFGDGEAYEIAVVFPGEAVPAVDSVALPPRD